MTRRRSLLLAALAFVVAMLLWQVPELSTILYPFRYFVTTVHELGHGLSAIATGGQFLRYEVFENGAGVATTAGGAGWIVRQAGYLGTALFGAVLLYLANRTRYTRTVAVVLGVAFAVLTVLFARNLPALIAGIISGAVLVLLGWKANAAITAFVLNLLAILTGLNALLDLWGLLHSLDSRVVLTLGAVPNDAYSMAEATGLPALFWAVLWMALAVILIGFSAYITFWRPLRGRDNASLI